MNYHKCKAIARKVWTAANGPIPKGYVIHHIDHNPENNDLSNLQCMLDADHKAYHNKSPITKARKSAAKSGEKHPMFGKKLSQEHKDKLSAAQSGEKGYMYDKEHTQETKDKISAAQSGKKHTQESKDKMSAAQSGEKCYKYDHTLYHFVHKDGTERHCTKHNLYTEFGLNQGNLSAVVHGKCRQHKGWSLSQQQLRGEIYDIP